MKRPLYHHDEHGHGHHGDHCCCHHGEEHGHHHEAHGEHDHCECAVEHHGLKTVHGPDCDCELCHPHAEYCDVCGQSLACCTCSMPDDGVEKAVYFLENLGCANCAAKMERKIKDLPGVKYASITFATKQLRLSANHQEELLPRIREICASIESDVKVVPRSRSLGKTKTVLWQVEGLKKMNDGEELERRVSALDGVTAAVFLPGTKQLKVTSVSPERLSPRLREICREIGKDLRLTEVKAEKPAESSSLWGKAEKRSIFFLLCGTALFIAAWICGELPAVPFGVTLALFIGSYLLLAHSVLRKAVTNIFGGRVFDENFLMAVASLGAFALGDYREAVAVVLFFCVGEFFEDRAVAKSRRRIMDAVDMRPETVRLLIGEEITEIPAADAVVGDILLVRPGDRIPLDGIVIDGESRLDTSPVTGESVPVAVGFGDEVLSGCVNTDGVLRVRVEKVLEESMVTRILDAVEQAAAGKPKMDRFITRFARVYTPCVVAAALLTAVIPSLITGAWSHWIYTALTFLVISCPCALVLSVPLAYFSGIGLGSRYGILFKGGSSMEAMKDLGAVVMDKTGTVTKGCFSVTEILCAPEMTETEILSAAASAELSSTHPIGVSILAAAEERGIVPCRPEKCEEISGKGIVCLCDGREILCGSQKLLAEKGVDVSFLPSDGEGTEAYVAVDGKVLGMIRISDVIKEDAASAVKELAAMGLTTAMLTGDSASSAAAVTNTVGIDEYHASLLPQDKLTALVRIRNHHGKVMFVGDGINDAPVLAGADVGAAMGSGADAAIEAADVVFMSSEMKAVPLSLKIASKVGRVAVQNIIFALAVKFAVLLLGLLGAANMWFAIFADTGVAILCVLNSIRILYSRP